MDINTANLWWSKWGSRCVFVLLLAEVIFILVADYRQLPSVGPAEYFSGIFEVLEKWVGRAVIAIAVILGALAFVRNKNAPEFNTEHIIQSTIGWGFEQLRKPSVSASIGVVLLVFVPFLVLRFRRPLPFLPPASCILVRPRQIYVANKETGRLEVYNRDPSPSQLNIETPNLIRPTLLAVAPNRRHEIYILDAGANKLVIADEQTLKTIGSISVDPFALQMVVTPDERKIYIGHVPPVGGGKITVIDLESRLPLTPVTGVNYPEGLAVAPGGRYLFASSQGGAGEFADPVFVVDAQQDRVIEAKTIPKMDVGSFLVFAPDGDRFYVARCSRWPGDTHKITIVPTQNPLRPRTLNFSAEVSALTVTPDSRFLIAGLQKHIVIVDAMTYTVVEDIPVEALPTGIVATPDGWIFAWITNPGEPAKDRIFFRGVGGVGL